MRSNTARLAAGLAVIALAVIGFVVLRGGDEESSGENTPPTAEGQVDQGDGGNGGAPTDVEPPPEPTVPVIRIQGGALAGEIEQIEATTGETVRFRVVADEAWDLHVHGYEVERTVQPGTPLVVSFPAEIEGAFEAEVHGVAGEFPIAEINVSPG